MLVDKYTMAGAAYKNTESDVFFIATSYSENASRANKYHSVMWLDDASKFGEGRLVSSYKSKTSIQRDYRWNPIATDVKSRALIQLFNVIFDNAKDRDFSQFFALETLIQILKTA